MQGFDFSRAKEFDRFVAAVVGDGWGIFGYKEGIPYRERLALVKTAAEARRVRIHYEAHRAAQLEAT